MKIEYMVLHDFGKFRIPDLATAIDTKEKIERMGDKAKLVILADGVEISWEEYLKHIKF